MSELNELKEKHKRLRLAVKKLIRAKYRIVHVGSVDAPTGYKEEREAEAELMELVTGESNLFNAAIAIKHPDLSTEKIKKMQPYLVECNTQNVQDVLDEALV